MALEATQIPIVEVGVIVIAALLFGVISGRFKLPTSMGYILAGVLLGPLALKFLTPGQGIAQLFGDIGLLLLLFYLGLELSIKKFKESGVMAVLLSIFDMGFPFLFGFIVSLLFGFGFLEALIIGTMLTATSTVMVSKFLFDRGAEKEPVSRTAISILVVEDFFAILVLAFLFSLSTAVSFKQTLLNGLLFVIAMFFVVSRVTRFASQFFEKHGKTSVMTLFALGVGIIVAYFSAYLGLTIALGAYFAGFALTETPFGERVKKEIGFMREFFILFFFVSFGTTVTLPSTGSIVLVLVLVASYILAKFIGYGVFATAVGVPLSDSVKLGMLMIPIGEFSLIIAATAAPFMRDAGEIISIAFMLTIVSTFVSPVLYDRSKQIASFLSSIYPPRFRNSLARLAKQLHSLERVYQNPALQNEFSASLKSFAANSIVALAIVYMSYLASFNIDFSVIPFLPKSVSVSVLILPLLVWPVYRAVEDLKFVAYAAVSNWTKAHYPNWRKHHEAGLNAAEIITATLLVLVGVFACVVFYIFLQPLVLVPLVFTLLAVMHLSKGIYELFEQAEDLDALAGEGITSQEVVALTREMGLRSKKFTELAEEREKAMREIKAALKAGKPGRARAELRSFKRREERIIDEITGLERKAVRREFSKLSREEQATKRALEEYFFKQAPRILGEKRKAALHSKTAKPAGKTKRQ